MLDIQEVCNLINNALNNNTSGYTFNIHSEIGEDSNDGSIQGIISQNMPKLLPLTNVSNLKYSFLVKLSNKANRSNKIITKIRNVIDTYFNNIYNGTTYAFKNGKGTISCTMPNIDEFRTEFAIGNTAPLKFGVDIDYSEKILNTIDKKWFINLNDGNGFVELPYLSEQVSFEINGQQKEVQGSYTKEAFNTSKAIFYHFTLPYTTNNNICKKLYTDLISGSDNEYVLKYYDGITYTSTNPYNRGVILFRTPSVKGSKPNISDFDIVFTPTSDNITTIDTNDIVRTSTYTIALIDNPFDNQTDNTRYFSSQAEQQTYYENKILTGCAYEPIKAPNLDSLDLTSQIYRNTRNYELFDLTNKNYAIIKVDTEIDELGETTTETKYFYYFVTNCRIGADNQISYDLKLDTIQTYFFNEDLQIEDTIIKRACLNRFLGTTAGTTVGFNNLITSPLLEEEPIITPSLYLKSREKQEITPLITDSEDIEPSGNPISDWIRDNIQCWAYYYVDISHQFTFQKMDSSGTTSEKFKELTYNLANYYSAAAEPNINILPSSTACICVPIYKTDKRIKFQKNGTSYKINIDDYGFELFKEANNGTTYFNAGKLSIMPPFPPYSSTTYLPNYNIDENGDLIISGYYLATDVKIPDQTDIGDYPKRLWAYNMTDYTTATKHGVMCVNIQYKEPMLIHGTTVNLSKVKLPFRTTFTKSEIINANKNADYNPKLLSQKFYTIRLSMGTSDYADYDAQKIGTNSVRMRFNETLSPDISRGHLRITDFERDTYYYNNKKNWLGLVYNVDNSLPLQNSALQNMLANNKNYYLQNQLNRVASFGTAVGSLVSAGMGVGQGNPLAVGGGILGAFRSALGIVNSHLQEDNLENAPGTLRNANGNPVFLQQTTDMGCYVEIYSMLDSQKEMVNDFMTKFGYSYNRLGNIADFVNIRKYFNYVQADIGNVDGISMSNVARADIRQRFSDGIRFWNSDNVNYSLENYEKWLEE